MSRPHSFPVIALLSIDGSRLIINGVFHNQATETEHEGTIDLTCPDRE
jgi:hypothetical protein